MTVVGLDVSAIPPQPRGAGRYVVELVRALARRGRVELKLETQRGDALRWSQLAPEASVHPVVPPARMRRLIWEQVAAPRFVDRWGVDVFHGPHYTMPEIARSPRIVTVHDLTFFDHPEWHERIKVSFFTRAIRVAANRADAIVCVSDATARRLRELVEVRGEVCVIPHGVDHDLFRPDDPAGADERLRTELGVRGRYLAFLGTLEPRKDVAGLVEAFDRIAGRWDDLQLVIAGGAGWANERFERAVAKSPHRGRIVRTGYVSDAAVGALLRGASAVVYPALEEGFGLPVLEALACGAPVVTTRGSVMEEIAAGEAVTVPPADPEALAVALGELLDEPHDSARSARGVEVARGYSWERAAEAHEQLYERVAAVSTGRP